MIKKFISKQIFYRELHLKYAVDPITTNPWKRVDLKWDPNQDKTLSLTYFDRATSNEILNYTIWKKLRPMRFFQGFTMVFVWFKGLLDAMNHDLTRIWISRSFSISNFCLNKTKNLLRCREREIQILMILWCRQSKAL